MGDVTEDTAKKLPRPKVVGGIIVKVVTGCGNMYIQLGWWNGRLQEVFATLGKGGGCSMSFNEALTRSVTTGLRFGKGVPVSEYVKQLSGVRCPEPRPFPKEDAVLSCPDALARMLKVYGSLTTKDMISLVIGLNTSPGGSLEDSELKEALDHIENLRVERESLEDDNPSRPG